jgi:sugar phosphate isomerase/epimerase
MLRGLSTHLFVSQRLTVSLLEQIERAGVEVVELFCARQHLDYHDRNQMREIGKWFGGSQLRLHSVHAPLYRDTAWGRTGPQAIVSITELEKGRRIDACDEIKRAIELAEYAPFRFLVMHFGVPNEEYDERKVDAAFSSVEHLHMFARQRGADLVLENIPNELSTPARLLAFVHYTHMGDLGLCFDTGHAHLGEGVAASFEKMARLVRTTHFHDNGGERDDHLFPFAGTIDWPRTIGDFRSTAAEVPIMLEIREQADVKQPLDRVREVFAKFQSVWEGEEVKS